MGGTRSGSRLLRILVVASALGAAGCGRPTTSGTASPPPGAPPSPRSPAPARTTEAPVPVESNPPGDIPDTAVFVPFRAHGGRIALRVPEGWARECVPGGVRFSDKLNAVTLSWRRVAAPLTPGAVRRTEVPELRRTERAFRLQRVLPCPGSCSVPYSTGPIAVHLRAGPAVVLVYRADSPPDPVTGRRYRLEVVRFEFSRHGEETALSLSGPLGADNVDPWRLIAESFRWT